MEAYGKCRHVLGRGPSGMFGHVELLLQTVSNLGQCSVQWQVRSNQYALDAREQVERAVSEYLSKYVRVYPEYSFHAVITEVTSDPERRNDYARAVNLALREALEGLGLPVSRIFSLESLPQSPDMNIS